MMSYLKNVVSLDLDEKTCIGCGQCVTVCPHAVFSMADKKAHIANQDACMECGACATNCPASAITVDSGVGCASGIIRGALTGTEPRCDCDCGCA